MRAVVGAPGFDADADAGAQWRRHDKARPKGRAVVGAPGFEPGTSCSRSKRATELRYAPNRVFLLPGEQLSGLALFHKVEQSANWVSHPPVSVTSKSPSGVIVWTPSATRVDAANLVETSSLLVRPGGVEPPTS